MIPFDTQSRQTYQEYRSRSRSAPKVRTMEWVRDIVVRVSGAPGFAVILKITVHDIATECKDGTGASHGPEHA
jgi:hypothetical protein